MFLMSKKLLGLKVETKSGHNLGHIKDFEVEIDSLEIKFFYVHPSGLVKSLVAEDLVISKESIISIDANKMVVEDLAEKEVAKEKDRIREIGIKGSAPAFFVREE